MLPRVEFAFTQLIRAHQHPAESRSHGVARYRQKR